MVFSSQHASEAAQTLQGLMQKAGFASVRSLSQAACVSRHQIGLLQQGKLTQMRLSSLLQLSQALQLPLVAFLAKFGAVSSDSSDSGSPKSAAVLQQEYNRLQTQMAQQQQELWLEFQQACLHQLESLLLQWPTAAYAAQQNLQAPAVRLLPLLKPLEQLLLSWGVEAIAAVGTEVPYDPQLHQLIDGSADPGDLVRVRYVGYRQADRLLYRAKVSPVG
jgi:molecular chaperone GrpE (heat shock protein)/DNA-binding Xre family transcriptional regulator